jgi:hemerythrin-like domain-containing protein
MLTPTQILKEEHQKILSEIGELEKECSELNAGGEIDKDFFIKKIDFIRDYADKFHHAKEEDILFTELCKDGVLAHCNPIPQMLHEHDVGRSFVAGLQEGLEQNNKDKIIENALGYANLLKEHIFKEDNILYPMADEALSEEKQAEILKKFEEKDKK